MKNNLPYYRQDPDDAMSPEHRALRGRYRWDGEGRFFMLKCLIAKSEHCHLDLRKGYARNALAADLGIPSGELDEFLAFLSDPEECNLLQCENNIYSETDMLGTLDVVMNQRKGARERYEKASHENEQRVPPEPKTSHEDSHIEDENFARESIQRNRTRTSKRKRTSKQQEGASVHFDEFWKAYPRKIEKQKAAKCYATKVKNGATDADLLLAAQNYAKHESGNEQKYMKHPATFLGPNDPWKEYLNGTVPADKDDPPSGEAVKLAKLLHERNEPFFPNASWEDSAGDIQAMLSHWTFEQLEDVIYYAHAETEDYTCFWRGKVGNGADLRRLMPKIYAAYVNEREKAER